LLRSLARGIAVAGTSPALLVTAFVGLLLIWLVYSSTGLIQAPVPGVMAQIEALPPMQSALDANFFGLGARVFPPAVSITLAGVLLLLRSALLAFSISLVIEWLQGSGGGRAAVRGAAARTYRILQVVVAIEALFLALVFVLPALLGAILGPLGTVLALVMGMYFVVFAPIVAVHERVGLRESVRLSARAARLRGPQHILLVFPYLLVSLYITLRTTGSPGFPVTPSFLVWAYALFMTFVHVAILAALTQRWRLVRGAVMDPQPAG